MTLAVQFQSDVLCIIHDDASTVMHHVDDANRDAVGIVGETHVWTLDMAGRLHLFDLRSGARHRFDVFPGERLSHATVSHRPGSSRLLFLVGRRANTDTPEQCLLVIDLPTGQVGARHDGLPGGAFVPAPARELADGRVLVPCARPVAEGRQDFGHVVIAGTDRTEDLRRDHAISGGFLAGSPDGRFWLRADKTSLWRRDVGGGGFLRRDPGVPWFARVLQVWEATPLRFVRRIAADWVLEAELPNRRLDPLPLPLLQQRPWAAQQPTIDGGWWAQQGKRWLWDRIAQATGEGNPDPLESPRPRFAPLFRDSEQAWFNLSMSWSQFAHETSHLLAGKSEARLVWSPDGDCVWHIVGPSVRCIGLDNTLSPPLRIERLRPEWPHIRQVPKDAEALPRRRARLKFATGFEEVDGAPSRAPYAPLTLPPDEARWHSIPVRAELGQQADAFLKDLRTVTLPLADWSQAGCIAAIDALAAAIRQRFAAPPVKSPLPCRFILGARTINEATFFARVAADHPAAASALAALLAALPDEARLVEDVFADDDEGIGVLGHAAKALAMLDKGSLPALRRYGAMMDREHEGHFVNTVVPAYLAAHGWSEDALDFAIWLVLADFFNALNHAQLWRDWGMRDAAAAGHAPEAFAARIRAALAGHPPSAQPEKFGHHTLGVMEHSLRRRPDDWTGRLFTALAQQGGG